jgi:hypothetical protein
MHVLESLFNKPATTVPALQVLVASMRIGGGTPAAAFHSAVLGQDKLAATAHGME